VTVCRRNRGGWRAERLHHPAPDAPRRQRRAGLATAPARHPGAAGGAVVAAKAAGQQQRPAAAHGAHRGGQQRRRGRRSAYPSVPERGKLREITLLSGLTHFLL